MKASQNLASFTGVETPPVNAAMWPLHALLWLQPELHPVRPSSGLRIERRHKTPAPDFVPAAITGINVPHGRESLCEPLPPDLRRRVPHSDLAPLGWDPRTLCAKGGAA